MKIKLSNSRFVAVFTAFFLFVASFSFAADSNTSTEVIAPVAVSPGATVQTTPPPRALELSNLPSAAVEVVKLTRAQVSEEVIVSYVQNAGATARLSSDDIVRLRQEGVTDRVINAMLDQNKRAVESTPPVSAPAPVTVYAANDPNAVNTAPTPQPAPVQVQSQPVEAPLTPSAASTVHVIPYPAATYAYYGPYYRSYYYSPYYYSPYYYGGYYGGGPIVSFRFGFGGHGHGHGHRHR